MRTNYLHEANVEYRRMRRRIPLGPLRNRTEYDRAVAVLDDLVDEIGEREAHPLADLAEMLALAIEAYEDLHVPIPESTGPAILRALMEEHGLSQSDLPEIGSQGVVSEVLSGKRDLNVRQIAKVSTRFGISPALFIPSSGIRTSTTARRKRAV
mgnify:FL=1|jgi:HTH-type transcriptional regulator/antitoxin HigA